MERDLDDAERDRDLDADAERDLDLDADLDADRDFAFDFNGTLGILPRLRVKWPLRDTIRLLLVRRVDGPFTLMIVSRENLVRLDDRLRDRDLDLFRLTFAILYYYQGTKSFYVAS